MDFKTYLSEQYQEAYVYDKDTNDLSTEGGHIDRLWDMEDDELKRRYDVDESEIESAWNWYNHESTSIPRVKTFFRMIQEREIWITIYKNEYGIEIENRQDFKDVASIIELLDIYNGNLVVSGFNIFKEIDGTEPETYYEGGSTEFYRKYGK